MVEQRHGPKEGDVLAIERRPGPDWSIGAAGAITATRPKTHTIRQTESQHYANKADRVTVRHRFGQIIAVIEIVSRGNRNSRAALKKFVDKSVDLIANGIHLVVVDLYPPSPLVPFGIHKAIWDHFEEVDFALPEGRNRIVASYEAESVQTAHVEPVGLGADIPDMPLFLGDGLNLPVPLEQTYRSTWDICGEDFREVVESGKVPDPDASED